MTPLIEACARAMRERTLSGDGASALLEEFGAWGQDEDFAILARAVIPVVLDAAAEVARNATEHWEAPEGLIPAGEFVVDAILELKPEVQS